MPSETHDDICETFCNPVLSDGSTPNPMYNSTNCPDYMLNSCSPGDMFVQNFENHQKSIDHYNHMRLFSQSMGFRTPQPFSYASPPNHVPIPPPMSHTAPVSHYRPVPQQTVTVKKTRKTPSKKSSKKSSKNTKKSKK